MSSVDGVCVACTDGMKEAVPIPRDLPDSAWCLNLGPMSSSNFDILFPFSSNAFVGLDDKSIFVNVG